MFRTDKENKIVYLQVRLIPNASSNKVIGVMNDGSLKVQTTVIPEKGKANKELINILSKHFKIPKSNIEISMGKISKNKTVKIDINNYEDLINQLEQIKKAQ